MVRISLDFGLLSSSYSTMKNLGENADREKIHTGQRTHLMKILYSPKPRFFVRDINTIARLLESTNHPTRNLRWDFVHQLLVLIGLELEKHVDVILQTEFVQSARDLIQESSRFFFEDQDKTAHYFFASNHSCIQSIAAHCHRFRQGHTEGDSPNELFRL